MWHDAIIPLKAETDELVKRAGQIEQAIYDWNRDRDRLLARVPGSGMGLVRKIKKDLPMMALKWGGAKVLGEAPEPAPESDDDGLGIPGFLQRP